MSRYPALLRRAITAGTIIGAIALITGCQSPDRQRRLGSSYHPVGPTPLNKPTTPVASEQRLDVAVSVFTSDPLPTGEKVASKNTTESIRKAETHYMPWQLKKKLDASSFWGEVRVFPEVREGHGYDVVVKSHIVESSDGRTALDVTAVDATGHLWMKKSYVIQLSPGNFVGKDVDDPADDLYRRIANDLADAFQTADPSIRQRIRRVSRMAFAARVSPEPFAQYLTTNPDGKLQLVRLPAADDPAWLRIQKVHGRDRVFAELVDKHYGNYHDQLKTPYVGWRQEVVTEREALQRTKKEGKRQAALGALLIGSAIALEAVGQANNVNTTPASVMIGAAGAMQVAQGVSTLKQQKMHRLALAELTESFSQSADPVVVEFEGRQIELKGTADEQYHRWQNILQDLYREETGLPEDRQSSQP
jgi:hypothetical protein